MPTTAKYVDFRRVKAAVPIDRVLSHYGVWKSFTGSDAQRRGPCPIHGGANKRQFNVNLDKGAWYCFGDCRRGGNVIELVAELEGCNIREAALQLAEWFDIPFEEKPGKKRKRKAKRDPDEDDNAKKVSREDPQRSDEESSIVQAVNEPLRFDKLKHLEHDHEALTGRGLLSDTAEHFGVGYATRGIMRGRIAIPVHSPDGELLAYAGADPNDPSVPYLWPKGFRPELEVYNAHRAAESQALIEDALIVVDDFFDVFALYEAGRENVVALLGGSVSDPQLEKLQALLVPVAAPRIMWAFRREALEDQPPYETLGRLSEIAWVLALPLAGL